MKSAVYAGSFDPLTLGHANIIERAASLFDKLYVVVGENTQKKSLFSVAQRCALLKELCVVNKLTKKIEICSHEGLTVDFCKAKKSTVLIRGLRSSSDFEKEIQIASMNKCLNPQIETLHLMTDFKYSFISSSIVKEIARSGGEVKHFVPPYVASALKKIYKGENLR